MASFISDLFESIFVAGAPPALLLATNASFLLLQITLIALAFYTSSIHFYILSLICAGLWWGINWFVSELDKVRKVEADAARLREIAKERGEVDEGYEGEAERERDGREGEGEGREGDRGEGGFDERDYRDVMFSDTGEGGSKEGEEEGDDGGIRMAESTGGLSMDERASSRASAAHAVTDDEGAEDMLRVEHGGEYGPDLGGAGTVRERAGRGKGRISAVESIASTEGETTEEEEGYEKIGIDDVPYGEEGGGKKRR